MTRSLLLLGFGVSLMMLLVGAGALVFLRKPPKPALPLLYPVPHFSLTDEKGQTFSSAEKLSGKVWVGNFVFTRCPTICPLFTRKMAEVQTAAQPFRDRVRLVSFTVDPKHDTPEVLKIYAQKYQAVPGLWSFVTGTHDELKKVIVGDLKISMSDQSDDIMAIAHGGHFVLVDARMNIRGYYNSEDADAVARLQADLKNVVEESR